MPLEASRGLAASKVYYKYRDKNKQVKMTPRNNPYCRAALLPKKASFAEIYWLPKLLL